MFGTSGTEIKTADGAVGPSGKPIRVFNVTSSSLGAAYPVLRNGTDANGTIYFTCVNAANTSVTTTFENGRLFPSGCWCDFDGALTSVVVDFRLES